MSVLLRLYPRAWRERYGEEFSELLASRRLSIQLVVDVLAGALDARFEPQAIPRPAITTTPGDTMTTTKWRCISGCQATRRDSLLGAGTMLGVTALLTAAWMALHAKLGDNEFVDGLSALPFFIGLLASFPFTYLKDRPLRSKVRCMVTMMTFITAILVGAAWLASRI